MSKERNKNIPAAYLLLRKDNNVLMLRRYNTPYQNGKYSVVAGHVDDGETFTDAIIREAKEEAGIDLDRKDIQVAHVMQRPFEEGERCDRIDVFFTAHTWNGEVKNMEPNKCDDLSWFSLNMLPEETLPYVKHAIECVRDGVVYSEYGWK